MLFVFDVDDTLYDMTGPFHKTVQALFPDFKFDLDALYKRTRYYSDLRFEDSMIGVITPLELQVYRITQAMHEVGITLSTEEAIQFQMTYARNQSNITLWEGYPTLFANLKKHDLLGGIITNGLGNAQRNKIKTLALETWFKPKNIIVSEEVGINKPNLGIFQFFETILGSNDKTIYFIGDSFESDIEGAKGAGWTPIWFNHRRHIKPVGSTFEVLEVHSISDLISLIESISKSK